MSQEEFRVWKQTHSDDWARRVAEVADQLRDRVPRGFGDRGLYATAEQVVAHIVGEEQLP